jgi:nucleoid DNA-binding protein
MIKIDIVKRVAQHLKLKDAEALAVTDAIIDSIKETICEEGRLEVRDFGVFQTKLRKSRVGRNPRNRKEYPIPPRNVVTFKLGKELKDFATQRSGPSRVISTDGDAGGSDSNASGPAAAHHQDSFLQNESD